MKSIYISIFLIFLMTPLFLSAQDRTCGAMEHLEHLQQQHPQIIQNLQAIEKHTQRFQNEGVGFRNVLTIPVVVHVVYRTNDQNISDAQVQSQIDVLTEDFRRLNADASETPPYFAGVAADVEIEFCLASIDPSGNPTNGIQRRKTNKPSFSTNDGVKFNSQGGLDAWPADSYLNIWSCNLGNNLLGYAQFPGGPAATDGVVIDYAYFGRIGTATAPYDEGRTGTHEVGHWLNLRHIWGDGPCGVDDFVADTPESDGPNYACPTGHISCATEDMVQNYMDYTYDGCMNIFTQGQSTRMRALFSPGGARYSLLSSNGCGGTPPPPPPAEICDNGIDDDGDGLTDCADSECFSDPACDTGGSCAPPTGLATVVTKGGQEANLSWNAVAGATSYNVILCSPSQASGNCGTPFNTTETAVVAQNLTKGASYEWCVETVCGGQTSGYVCQSFVAQNGGREGAFVSDLTFYPNPARSQVIVELEENYPAGGAISLSAKPLEGTYRISLVDLTGRTIRTYQASYTDSFAELNVAGVSQGLYLIKVMDHEGNLERAGKVMILND